MYETEVRGELDADAVLHHHHSLQGFMTHYNRLAAQVVRGGVSAIRDFAPRLIEFIGDPRTMRIAWDHLTLKGGQAPGENGHCYRGYCSAEVWDMAKCLATSVRQGKFNAGPERIIKIKKSSGGTRPLVLLNIEERVVQRAVVSIMQPLLDPIFDERSFGYRPRRGHLHALALGEYRTVKHRRRVWLTQDIKDAFQQVPMSRLLQVINKLLPDRQLIDLLGRILPAQKLDGLRQGGPLSPLSLNLYLSHFLDRPWRREFPTLPLVRVADDLLVPCYSEHQALKAHEDLAKLLLPAGMPLKFAVKDAIHDLNKGVVVPWLGFNLSKTKGGLAAEIGIRSWDRLEERLALAHTKSDSPVRAVRTIERRLDQRGPCYPWTDREQACQMITDLAKQQGFEEVPTKKELQALWQRAHARWCKLRGRVRRAAETEVTPKVEMEENDP